MVIRRAARADRLSDSRRRPLNIQRSITMEDNKKNSHANEDSVEFHSGDLVILTDDDGNEVRYEYLDQIEYSDKVYDILVPEDSENVEVYLENGNSDITLETNPKTAEAVFGLFKTKNADRFDFS